MMKIIIVLIKMIIIIINKNYDINFAFSRSDPNSQCLVANKSARTACLPFVSVKSSLALPLKVPQRPRVLSRWSGPTWRVHKKAPYDWHRKIRFSTENRIMKKYWNSSILKSSCFFKSGIFFIIWFSLNKNYSALMSHWRLNGGAG